MKKLFLSLAKLICPFLLIFIACKKNEYRTTPYQPPPYQPPVMHVPQSPIAHAGNDTTIYLPFSSHNLNGSTSTDPDSNIMFYRWRQLAGPSPIDFYNYSSVKAFVGSLLTVGIYEFELAVTDADTLSSKDTIRITVEEPNCTTPNNEVIIKDLPWDYSWIRDLVIDDIFSYLPPNSYLRNIYIKRDSSSNWEIIVPYDAYSPDKYNVYTWDYVDELVVIYPGIPVFNSSDDTPDVKVEYCN